MTHKSDVAAELCRVLCTLLFNAFNLPDGVSLCCPIPLFAALTLALPHALI